MQHYVTQYVVILVPDIQVESHTDIKLNITIEPGVCCLTIDVNDVDCGEVCNHGCVGHHVFADTTHSCMCCMLYVVVCVCTLGDGLETCGADAVRG